MNYIHETTQRLHLALAGADTTSKLKLINMVIFESVPSHIRKKTPRIDHLLDRLVERHCHNMWLKIKNLYFCCVDYGSLGIIRDEFEPFMQKYFTPTKDEVVIDVGANVGKYTLESAKAVGNSGLVVAIEPIAENYSALLQGIIANKLQKNIVPYNCAAGKNSEVLKLFIGINSGTHSSKCNQGKGTQIVPCRRIDDIVDELKLQKVNWLKIDVEGAEFTVLEGTTQTLTQFKPKIIIEVWDANRENVITLLESKGYACHEIERLAGIDTVTLGGCSYFFCRT